MYYLQPRLNIQYKYAIFWLFLDIKLPFCLLMHTNKIGFKIVIE